MPDPKPGPTQYEKIGSALRRALSVTEGQIPVEAVGKEMDAFLGSLATEPGLTRIAVGNHKDDLGGLWNDVYLYGTLATVPDYTADPTLQFEPAHPDVGETFSELTTALEVHGIKSNLYFVDSVAMEAAGQTWQGLMASITTLYEGELPS